MTLGHSVWLHRSVFDTREILDKERPLVVEKLVFVLLIWQQHLVHRLCHCPEETAQLLFAVLAPHTQLAQYTSHQLITNDNINK